ncbi:hypothetical protein GCM10023235_46080 [Kitasatospora terrestris]|uniref:Uncharacterized protein n=1 Tax=Kitasatospora terrestris TaxID=258051 RepID=A0ABP9DX43_9ACTN
MTRRHPRLTGPRDPGGRGTGLSGLCPPEAYHEPAGANSGITTGERFPSPTCGYANLTGGQPPYGPETVPAAGPRPGVRQPSPEATLRGPKPHVSKTPAGGEWQTGGERQRPIRRLRSW